MLTAEIDPKNIAGIGDFSTTEKILGKGMNAETVKVFWTDTQSGREDVGGRDKEKTGASGDKSGKSNNGRAWLVARKNTIELRTDTKLAAVLIAKYETVMESRYFGKNGVEIVLSGQLKLPEIEDLIRLSYSLTRQNTEV